MKHQMKWDEFLNAAARINKAELRINFERAKEYMTAYEIADTMREAFSDQELDAIARHIGTRTHVGRS